jgi:membrane-bound ClpP family serine protease
MHTMTTADKIAMYGGGGLVLLGTFAIGLLEMLLGSGHPVDGEGQIVHEALVPLEIRSYIIILGLAIWGLYAVYKLVATTPQRAKTV